MDFNILDTKCSDKALLKVAFTHPSYIRDNGLSYTKSYERLEFLGDAVLKLVCSKLLYMKYPFHNEGELSKIRSILISDNKLADVANKINLKEKMILGHGEEMAGGRDRESNIACTMEAVLGAYFLDGKFDTIEKFIETYLIPLSDDIEEHFEKYNAKSVLQEYTQKESSNLPIYKIESVHGPKHKPIFTVSVSYKGEVIATATGYTKKEAEQNCAYKACAEIGIIKDCIIPDDTTKEENK